MLQQFFLLTKVARKFCRALMIAIRSAMMQIAQGNDLKMTRPSAHARLVFDVVQFCR